MNKRHAVLNQGTEHYIKLRKGDSLVVVGMHARPAASGVGEAARRMREGGVDAVVEVGRRVERELGEAKKQLALGGGGAGPTQADEAIAGTTFTGQVLHGLEAKALRGLLAARMDAALEAISA